MSGGWVGTPLPHPSSCTISSENPGSVVFIVISHSTLSYIVHVCTSCAVLLPVLYMSCVLCTNLYTHICSIASSCSVLCRKPTGESDCVIISLW